jgi:gliding motility-associated-like protein
VVVIQSSQEIPVPDIILKPISCYGENDGMITINAVNGGLEPYLFSLNGSPYSEALAYPFLQPGVYDLSIIDANGCENMVTFDMQQPQELHVELIVYIEGDHVILLGDSARLEALVTVPADSLDLVSWQPSALLSCDSCLSPIAHPVETTTFSVTVENNGCRATDEMTIFVKRNHPVYVPNAFSPNGDGLNDVFTIYAGPQTARIKSFLVFNRWGETVYTYKDFAPNDPAAGWDGTHRGKPMNPSVFTWFAEIEFIDGYTEVLEGDVTLVR